MMKNGVFEFPSREQA